MKPALYKALRPYRRLGDSRWRRVLERKRQERARSRPPRRPKGWETGPPDFVGVGAQRAGTTWWYFLIEQHPQVTRRYPKELQYFVRRPEQEIDASHYWRYFARKPGTVVGEWTPSYMFFDWVMRDLAAAAPDAQIIINLRDPVDRYMSAIPLYEELYMEGLPKRERDSLLLRGAYGAQIERVFRYFDPDRVLILQYERCKASPRSELERTYRFLGLDEGFVPEEIGRLRNVLPKKPPPVSESERSELVDRYSEDVLRLLKLVPHLDLDLWPNFRAFNN